VVLSTNVLVLNRLYQPVHVTSVRRALILLYRGAARAVDEQYQTFDFESWAELSAAVHEESLGTSSGRLRVPRVILLQAYDHLPRARVRFSRLNIYARDKNTCQYCGRRPPRAELNLDHVLPRSRGGNTSWENVVCSCVACNLRKGGRTPEEARMHLLRAPVRPRWTPFFRSTPKTGGFNIYKQWVPFLHLSDVAYWNAELQD
jgi:5-methylcytosine-specific restriction endonuclease McrA